MDLGYFLFFPLTSKRHVIYVYISFKIKTNEHINKPKVAYEKQDLVVTFH